MDSSDSTDPRIPLWLFAFVIGGGAVGYFWYLGDHAAASAAAGVALAAFAGYCVGAARFVGLFGGVALAGMLAPAAAAQIDAALVDWLEIQGPVHPSVSIGCAGIAITIGTMLLVTLLSRWMLHDDPPLQACNRWAGFLVGGVQGVGLALLVGGALLLVEPHLKQGRLAAGFPREHAAARALTRRVGDMAAATRTSRIGPWVERYNPFEHVDQLKQLQRHLLETASAERPVRGPGDPIEDAAAGGMPGKAEWLQRIGRLLRGKPTP